MSVTRSEILNLYKKLMQYSQSLNLTDVKYFRNRVSNEFRRNKALTKPQDINFAYKVKLYSGRVQYCKTMLSLKYFSNLFKVQTGPVLHCLVALKHIDYSRVPKINESDLAEQFVRGGGPGGSAVNKNANCVVLTHNPTGTVIKCHISRCQDENRKLAREMLIAKLDEVLNGENSVAAQKRRLNDEKLKKNEYKRKKMAKLKEEWKKREGLA